MNYATIRKAIFDQLIQVEGIGKIFEHERYSSDWQTFLDRYKMPNPADSTQYLINLGWITRRDSVETSDMPYGSRDEAERITTVGVSEQWIITLVYGFADDEDSDASSEHAFQTLIDNVKAQFRTLDQLGIPDTVQKSEPLKATGIGLYMLADVLCHKTELILQVTQYHTW